jgi:beta-lactamase regulating signal transducer with metallopeptidase domain
MGDLFYWLFNMSIAGSIAGAVILLLRLIRHIPRRVIAVLWAIPLIRFFIPFGIGGRFGLLSQLSRYTTRTVEIFDNSRIATMTNYTMAAKHYFPIEYKINLLADVFRIASIVWAVIAGALLLAMIIVYLATVSELRDAVRMHDNVYCSDKITSPAAYGIFRTRIILPTQLFDSEDIDLIVLHEQRHIRRLDNLWRVIAFCAAALHWFNPLAWVFLKLYLSDVELACDESVLSKLSEEDQKRYAHALLNAQKSRTVFASAFGGARLRTRIERIVSFRKMTVVSVVGFGILTCAIAYILLTNAA